MNNCLIGQGTYGCVFKPPISCKYVKNFDQKHKDDIMKVADSTTKSSIMEQEISVILKQIDALNNYFIGLSGDSCILDDNNKNIKSCKIYTESNYSFQIKGFYLKYGGPTIDKFIKTYDINLNDIWKWLNHLIYAIKLLHDNDIVHLDIKENNIVIGDDDLPKIIDFGLSGIASKYDDEDMCQFYDLEPLFCSAKNTNDIKELYNNYEYLAMFFISNYVKNSETDIILKLYNLSRKSKYFKNAIKSNNFYMNPHIKPKFSKKAGIFKIDVYMLMNMFNNEIYNIKFKNENPELFNKISQIINLGLNIYPDKQGSIYDVIKILH